MKSNPTEAVTPVADGALTVNPAEPALNMAKPNPALCKMIEEAREDYRREEAAASLATGEPLGLD
jgi:hypothetical protein